MTLPQFLVVSGVPSVLIMTGTKTSVFWPPAVTRSTPPLRMAIGPPCWAGDPALSWLESFILISPPAMMVPPV